MSGERAQSFLKASSAANSSFWIKGRTGEDMGQFSIGPINKTILSFRKKLREYVKAGAEHFEHLL